jgi:hypothetical protein
MSGVGPARSPVREGAQIWASFRRTPYSADERPLHGDSGGRCAQVPVIRRRRGSRSKPSLTNRRTKNLRAVQLLLSHTKLESTVRYLGIEVEDALELAEQTEV